MATDSVLPNRATIGARALLVYVALGVAFGIVVTKAEVVSWYRIQEMFRFQALHMYGIIGSAIAVASLGLFLIRRSGVRSAQGEPIVVPPKSMGRGTRYWLGGLLFGLGWALTGACPGPMLALTGTGVTVMLAAMVSAVFGTFAYGMLRTRLPH